MSDENKDKITEHITHTEAPYSVNFYGVTGAGWNCQFTIRSQTEDGLTTAMGSLITRLEGYGVTPKPVGRQPTNDTQQHSAQPEPPPNFADAPQVDPSWCPIHNVQMKRYEKGDSHWFSHKHGDAWCKGK